MTGSDLDTAFSDYLGLGESKSMRSLVGKKAVTLLQSGADRRKRATTQTALLAFCSGMILTASVVAFVLHSIPWALLGVLVGMVGLAPAIREYARRREPEDDELIASATTAQRRYIHAAFAFRDDLTAGRIKAFEWHGNRKARQIPSSIFEKEFAFTALVLGAEYWQILKARFAIKNRLPVGIISFQIGDARAPLFVDGNWLLHARLSQFEKAYDVILEKVDLRQRAKMERHLDHLRKLREVDSDLSISLESRAMLVKERCSSVTIKASTLEKLAGGNLQEFEKSIQQHWFSRVPELS
ncbi:MAG: hypothetical protein AAFY19_02710 [Pseudomonadota bacterium]